MLLRPAEGRENTFTVFMANIHIEVDPRRSSRVAPGVGSSGVSACVCRDGERGSDCCNCHHGPQGRLPEARITASKQPLLSRSSQHKTGTECF